MPKVGGRVFDYTKAGRLKAAAYAKRTGKTVRNTRSSDRRSAAAVRLKQRKK